MKKGKWQCRNIFGVGNAAMKKSPISESFRFCLFVQPRQLSRDLFSPLVWLFSAGQVDLKRPLNQRRELLEFHESLTMNISFGIGNEEILTSKTEILASKTAIVDCHLVPENSVNVFLTAFCVLRIWVNSKIYVSLWDMLHNPKKIQSIN